MVMDDLEHKLKELEGAIDRYRSLTVQCWRVTAFSVSMLTNTA